jgi:hypothetical protein
MRRPPCQSHRAFQAARRSGFCGVQSPWLLPQISIPFVAMGESAQVLVLLPLCIQQSNSSLPSGKCDDLKTNLKVNLRACPPHVGWPEGFHWHSGRGGYLVACSTGPYGVRRLSLTCRVADGDVHETDSNSCSHTKYSRHQSMPRPHAPPPLPPLPPGILTAPGYTKFCLLFRGRRETAGSRSLRSLAIASR